MTRAGHIPQQSASSRTPRHRAFTTWVEEICVQDAGARTALRSGLRKNLDSVPRMHRMVAPWLPEGRLPVDTERAYYAVAAMIAAQPRSAQRIKSGPAETDGSDEATRKPASRVYGTSLGTAFALAVVEGPVREKEMRAGTAESRLNLLTRQSVNGLHRHLPASVGYLRSVGVPVDWAQLLDDLSNWGRHSGRISRRWLQDFYRLRERAAREAADRADEQELSEADLAAADAT
ncbi:type I-E CRISPR-associated protein Cse2/CasB (plasmid) [Streptomyces sp. NBC_01724]|uniref:type I-E CRISPR-associated protein Cse2/CasB n=1 Tax=Streptomyces sp. NBC_01724 TaxID=2975922 RepID=UPI002E2FD89D|nr:type I-E CRISPR-associated protein Cse2/CasB [Streptomyces sp. NBC_01724]